MIYMSIHEVSTADLSLFIFITRVLGVFSTRTGVSCFLQVLIIANSKSNHLGAQGTFNPWSDRRDSYHHKAEHSRASRESGFVVFGFKPGE